MHSLFLCLRYLRKKRLAFIGVVAVALCVALLVVVTSLFSGVIDSYEAGVVARDGDIECHFKIPVASYGTFLDRVEALDEVQSAMAALRCGGLLYLGKGDVRGVLLVGTDLDRLARGKRFGEGLLSQGQGKPDFSLSQASKKKARAYLEKKFRRPVDDASLPIPAVMGIGVFGAPDELTDAYDHDAIRQRLKELDQPFLIKAGQNAQESPTGQAPPISQWFWPVYAVQMGWYNQDGVMVYLPLDAYATMQGIDQTQPTWMSFHIHSVPGFDFVRSKQAIMQSWVSFATQTLGYQDQSVLQAYSHIGRSIDADWVSLLLREIRKQLRIIQLILSFIGLVASFLIFVILYMMVMSKKRDIGILRSVGSSRSSIAMIFIGFGLGIGVVGTSLGLGLGVWITENMREVEIVLSKLLGFKIWKTSSYQFLIPNAVAWQAIAWIPLAGIALAVLGALIPALRAAKLQPAESLRYE